ncbi:MAG: fibronectin type III domain-containing protein [Bacillota bacterium]
MKQRNNEIMFERFRKHIAVLLTFCIAFFQLPAAAFADDTDFTYSVDGGEVTITGYTGSGGDAVIPDTIGANPVVAIGTNAFSDEASITSIQIPDTVTTIGDGAFSGCTSLEKAYFKGHMPGFGTDVFAGVKAGFRAYHHLTDTTWDAYALTDKQPYVVQTVKFHDGTTPDSVSMADVTDGKLSALDDPVRGGYTFAGWYDNEAYTGEAWDFATDTVGGDITFHAKWVLAPPAVPQSVTAVSAGYDSVRISWDAVSGADGYTVYRSTTSTGDYTPVKDTASTSYTDTGLTTGQTYYYKVEAYNDAGSSGLSSAASARPVPAAPESVTAVSAASDSIMISWDAVAGADGYFIYRAASSTGEYSLICNAKATSIIDRGLTLGQLYYYKVRAYKDIGSERFRSEYSKVVSARPVTSVPQSVKAVSASYNSIKISWGAVTGADGYMVCRSTSSTGTFTAFCNARVTSITDSGLTTGQTYYYMVRPYRFVNSVRLYGTQSPVVSAKPVPAMPSSVKAVAYGYTGIKVSWSAVSGAYAYTVYRSNKSTGPFSAVTATRRTSYVDNFLKTSKTYYYKIVAYCKLENGTKVYGGYSQMVSSKPGTADIYDKLIATAQRELGYEEVKANPTDADGWTKYAVDYPIWKYGAWCACFVTWCAKQVNLLGTTIPKYSWVLSGKAWYKERGRFKDVSSSYVPKKGDVIFFHEPDSPANSDNHTGFVEAYDPEKKIIYTIEGNIHDSVDRDIHGRFDAYVTGFGVNGGTSLGQIPVIVPLQAKAVALSGASIKVSWDDTDSTCTYEVYRTAALGGTYTYLGSTTSGSYTDEGLTTGKTYYYKVRAYRVVDGTRIYSVYTQPLSAKTS